jgi:hypothetical protein
MAPFIPNSTQLKHALSLAEQIHALEEELRSVLAGAIDSAPRAASQPTASAAKPAGRGRSFSAATKAKMAAAQRARWARNKGPGTASPVASAPKAARASAGKRRLSAEGRARIVAALKARHAANRLRKGA